MDTKPRKYCRKQIVWISEKKNHTYQIQRPQNSYVEINHVRTHNSYTIGFFCLSFHCFRLRSLLLPHEFISIFIWSVFFFILIHNIHHSQVLARAHAFLCCLFNSKQHAYSMVHHQRFFSFFQF